MQTILESVMLICFGISWPISVYKSYTSKSTKGKSVVFIIAIIIGYLAGISGKIIGNSINYVLVLYMINLLFVTTDLALFIRNRNNELKCEQRGTACESGIG